MISVHSQLVREGIGFPQTDEAKMSRIYFFDNINSNLLCINMNLLKKSYIQRALREEAKGNYKQAAAYYSKAEEFEMVGEMHELLGDMTRAFPAKIRAYQQAIRWYKQPEHIKNLARKLAETMEREIRADAKVATTELQRLTKAAEYYTLAKQWNKAGNIYEELGMYDEATEAYIQGGEVERVEQLSVRKEERDHRKYSSQQYYDEAKTFHRIGQRDKAYQFLKQCLTIDSKHVNAKELCTLLHRALQPTGVRRIHIAGEEKEYLLFGNNIIMIGRKEDNDIVLTQNDVSRHHARLGFQGHTCIIEDLQSSNGTRLNGLRIQKAAALHNQDVIGIGINVQFEVRIYQHTSGISVLLTSKDEHIIQKHYVFFLGEMQIGSGSEYALTVHGGSPGSPSCKFKVKYQQPYWYVSINPHLTEVELNGVPVEKYVVVIPGDTLRFAGMTFLFD